MPEVSQHAGKYPVFSLYKHRSNTHSAVQNAPAMRPAQCEADLCEVNQNLLLWQVGVRQLQALQVLLQVASAHVRLHDPQSAALRSEERRVGKECRL